MNILTSKLRENVLLRRLLSWSWQLFGVFLCWWLAFQVRFDFSTDAIQYQTLTPSIWIVAIVFIGCIGAFRLYQGLWRFFTFRDCLITSLAFLVGTVIVGLVIFIERGFTFTGFPRSVLVINYLLILCWEIGGRGLVRLFRDARIEKLVGDSSSRQKRIVLVGAPEECDSLIRSLNRQSSELGHIAAIVTDDGRHAGGKLHGVRVYSNLAEAGKIVHQHDADVVIILPPFTAPSRVRDIVDSVSKEQVGCEFRVLPSMDDIASGKIGVSRIRKVEVEDLLDRDPYQIDLGLLHGFVSGKNILVTGAGGSIGSEICRQILKLEPASITLFEINEFSLFQIERELVPLAGETVLHGITGDVKKEDDIRGAIRAVGSGIDIIYHAAAYKHVDLMERNPFPCIENNVIGTATLAAVAEDVGVSQFVLISTDKAVRPTSLMGMSKRLAERCIIERPKRGTEFKAVRFGNVLGSSGSVVPIFREQIANGGPVTVTSKDVKRYFMTIPEAVELVLSAGSVAEDRRICVLEMGEPVKIDRLARRMIELSGFVVDKDIQILYTGLKKGEKEFEELLTDDENVEKTAHDRIWIVRKNDNAFLGDSVDIGRIFEIIDTGDIQELREYVQSLIPNG